MYQNINQKLTTMTTRNEGKFTFVNTSGNTRNGFYHESTLLINGVQLSKARCNYLNRTWESYQFQSSMMQAVENAIANEVEDLISDYKREHNVTRLSTKIKDSLTSKRVDELNELLKTL